MLALLLLSLSHASEPTRLTVDEAIATLEANNPAISRARAQADAARGAVGVAWGSASPSVVASGGYARNNAEATLDLGPLFEALEPVAALTGQQPPEAPDPVVIQPLSMVSGGVIVKVPLVVPSAWAGVHAARQGVDAAEASVEATTLAQRAAAWQAFWLAAAAEAAVDAQESSTERARALAESAEAAVAAGTAPPLSMLQAQTDLARREGDVLQARAALEKARLAVGAVLGVAGPVAVDLPERPVPSEAVDLAAALADAAAARAELDAVRGQVAAARASLMATRLGALPTLSGSFTATAASEPYVTGEDTAWRAGIDLTWHLVQGGARVGAITRAAASVEDAEAALAATERLVDQQVRAALTDYAAATARVAVAERQRTLAEEGARVATRTFEAGLAEAAVVLDALDRLDLARAAAIDAQARLGMADVALRAATGGW